MRVGGDGPARVAAARSWLFVPGSRPDRFAKAVAAGPDVVVLDLEDAVAESDKEAARAAVAGWLHPDRPAVVRVNAEPDQLSADLRALRRPGLLAVMLPKAEDPGELAGVLASLAPYVGLVPLVETARGVCAVAALAGTPGVTRLAFGSLDLALDLGVDPDGGGGILPAASHQLVLQSRAARLAAPVAGVTVDTADPDALARDVALARADGFGAKLCIHPRQVEAVNRGFAATAREAAWAQRVLDAAGSNPGVFRLDGQMVDRPVLERARRLLAAAPLNRPANGS
ncbi:MAG: CoA ester lyase [Frankiales bacterium]|nr:CoA ester lyase [Frankiales bacterium]